MRSVALALLLLAPVAQDPGGELFPLAEGTAWTYVSGGREARVVAGPREKIGEAEAVLVTTTPAGGDVRREWFRADASGVKLLRQAVGERVEDYAPPIERLRLPLKEGDAWTWKGRVGKDEATAEFRVAGREAVTTPSGVHDAWKVEVTLKAGGYSAAGANWYAPGVGIVRQVTVVERDGKKQEGLVELKSFEPPKK